MPTHRTSRVFLLVFGASGLAQMCLLAADIDSKNADLEFFEKKVRPLLVNRCYPCHGPDSIKAGGLTLDSRASLVRGGGTGPAVTPGKPEASLLIQAVNYKGLYKMPPTGKLPVEEIATLTEWVSKGLPWPGDQLTQGRTAKTSKFTEFAPEQRKHWAFQKPMPVPVPKVNRTLGFPSPIDSFVLAQFEEKGTVPNPPVDRRTLIRRATFDLHGLPPSPEEVQAFLQDQASDAFAKVVDRLLTSPRYGERWGRHWLDVARYSDSNGSDANVIHANAWRYRDYVVKSFNEDKPFDQFIREQLAGDLLPASDIEERNRNWIATGFLVMGPKTLLQDDPVRLQMEVVDEQLDTIGRAFMGLTLGCARCHDHKFDPISTADYYSLAGIFMSTRVVDKYEPKTDKWWTESALGTEEDEWKLHWWRSLFDRCNDEMRVSVPARNKFFKARMKEIREQLAMIPAAMVAREDKVVNARINIRGNHLALGDEVPRQFPRILAGENQQPLGANGSGRLELAKWLTDANHSLTARVMVNRVWAWHFGDGIVRSTDNFGLEGEAPNNQPLLDYLAIEFARGGWSIKSLHRLMMLSSTYQRSSAYNADSARKDPENRSLWRMNRRRLEAEEIRDALLMASGQLDFTFGGSLIPQILNHDLPKDEPEKILKEAYKSTRRSVYLPVIRSGLYDMFEVFDFADPGVVAGRRNSSTVAPQALFMMNSDLVWQVSEKMSDDVLQAGASTEGEVVRKLYQQLYGRPPEESEISRALKLAKKQEQSLAGSEYPQEVKRRAWAGLCRALVAANEFVYVQ